MSLPVPPSVWDAIAEFVKSGKWGRVEIDVRAGEVIACRVTESIRVNGDNAMGNAMEFKGPVLAR